MKTQTKDEIKQIFNSLSIGDKISIYTLCVWVGSHKQKQWREQRGKYEITSLGKNIQQETIWGFHIATLKKKGCVGDEPIHLEYIKKIHKTT